MAATLLYGLRRFLGVALRKRLGGGEGMPFRLSEFSGASQKRRYNARARSFRP